MQSTSRIRIAFLLLPALASLGANWYVAPGGSNSNNCTQANPCATVPHGISKMQDGDTLFLADGTYGTGAISAGPGCFNGTTHISIRPNQSCPQHGCTIRAENITDPPSVTLTNSNRALTIRTADNWTIQGLEIIANGGLAQCEAHDTTYKDMRFVFTRANLVHFFSGGARVLMDNVETYRQGKPCDVYTLSTPYHGLSMRNISDVTIQDSYLGYVMYLGAMVDVNGFTIKRSHLQHWGGHGLSMQAGTRNVLIENSIMGGVDGCEDSLQMGPRLIDMYEATNVTVRNNTIVGHGYSPRSMVIAYGQFTNTNAGCELSPSEPGFCEFDKTVTCNRNDIPKIPGVLYSEASSQCPTRNDGKPWSPNQRCSGVCDRVNVKFYNNIVYDLRDTGVPEAGARYVDWLATGIWSNTQDLKLDGNYYSEGVVNWICAAGGGNKYSMEAWRAAECDGGPYPDPHSIVGRCSGTTSQACGTDSDCPGSQSCVPTPPSFVNYAGDNYRPSSAAAVQVNAGMGGVDAQGIARCATHDFDGNPRNDGSCDIGAFEFQGSGGSGGPGDPPDDPPEEPPGNVLNPRRSDTTSGS